MKILLRMKLQGLLRRVEVDYSVRGSRYDRFYEFDDCSMYYYVSFRSFSFVVKKNYYQDWNISYSIFVVSKCWYLRYANWWIVLCSMRYWEFLAKGLAFVYLLDAVDSDVCILTRSNLAEIFSTLILLVLLKLRVASIYCPGTNPVFGIVICTFIEPLKQQRL